jgi:PKHD-type hydroxylase|tara:strand:+ start:1020 stop:1652 length:633 start_codon:yes stop_codon:yes gene_type:complete
MNLKYSYWFFKSALPNHFCDKLIKYGNSKQEQIALTGDLKPEDKENLKEEELNDLKQKRDSNIVWLNERWLYRYIHHYVNVANFNSGWNFEWDFSENAQFTKYKLNQFYDWHCDSWQEPYNDDKNENLKGKIRKLSVTCSLSDPTDYEGGEFEFKFIKDKDGTTFNKVCYEIMPKGSIIVFPSFIYHRVRPVTKGNRYSLVMWNCGKPWK